VSPLVSMLFNGILAALFLMGIYRQVTEPDPVFFWVLFDAAFAVWCIVDFFKAVSQL
jgi:hypothetical protein